MKEVPRFKAMLASFFKSYLCIEKIPIVADGCNVCKTCSSPRFLEILQKVVNSRVQIGERKIIKIIKKKERNEKKKKKKAQHQLLTPAADHVTIFLLKNFSHGELLPCEYQTTGGWMYIYFHRDPICGQITNQI